MTRKKPQGKAINTSKPLGRVSQIIVERGGKTFVHTFLSKPELLATSLAGVLVIHGKFNVRKDMIHG